MTLRGLQARLARLEEKRRKKNTRAPTRAEYDDAAFRDRVRNLYNAKLRLYQINGREGELWQKLSDRDRETLESDTEEQRARDRSVMRMYEKANGAGEDSEAGGSVAARVRQKLRSLKRGEGRGWPSP